MMHGQSRFQPARLLPIFLTVACCRCSLQLAVAAEQTLEQARDRFIHGQYEAVIQAAQTNLANRADSIEWRVLLTKALLTVGRYDEAHTNAMAALNDSPTSPE